MGKKFKDRRESEAYFYRFDKLIKKRKYKKDLSHMSPYEIINYLRENDVKKNYKVLPSNKILHKVLFSSFCLIVLVSSYGVVGNTHLISKNVDVFTTKTEDNIILSNKIDYMAGGDLQTLIDIYRESSKKSIDDHFEFSLMLRSIGNVKQSDSELLPIEDKINGGSLVRSQEVNNSYVYRLLDEYLINNNLDKSKEILDRYEPSLGNEVKFKEKKIIYNLLAKTSEEAHIIYSTINKDSLNSVEDLVSFSKLSILFNNLSNALEGARMVLKIDPNETKIIEIVDMLKSYDKDKVNSLINDMGESIDYNMRFIRSMINSEDLLKTQSNLEDIVEFSKVNKDSMLAKGVKLDVLTNAKREEETKVILSEFKAYKDKNFYIDYVLSKYNFKTNNINEALNYAKDSISLNDKFSPSYDLITDILISENKISNLNYFYLKMKSLDILNTSIDKNFIIKYTDSFNDPNKALEILEFSNSISLYDADFKYQAGKIYIDQRKDNEAKNLLYEAINLSNKPVYYRTLGVLLVSMGEVDLGIENIRKAYELSPDDILNLNNAAAYYANIEKDIQRAFSNIKASYENLDDSYSEYESFIIRENYFKLFSIYDEKTGKLSSDDIPTLDYLY